MGGGRHLHRSHRARRGAAGPVDPIGTFFQKFPGARFELTSGIDAHHGKVRFTWRMVLANGKVPVEGIDFGELAASLTSVSPAPTSPSAPPPRRP